MGVHVFGGTSSPGCCNCALRKKAIQNENAPNYDTEVAETLLHNFYLDDLLKSMKSEEIAIQLIKDVRRMCGEGGFNLTKFICNRKAVLQFVPECHRRSGVQNVDLDGTLPVERRFRIYWDVDKETFNFKINLTEKPMTRRGMLSMISSIFGPLGFVVPYTLKEKKLLQQLCQDEVGWDETAPDEIVKEWQMWCKTLQSLDTYEVTRCYTSCGFGKEKEFWIHYFSVASEAGYCQISFIRMVNFDGAKQNFIMGKARAAPKKYISIPRLDLVVATLSVKMAKFLRKKIEYWLPARNVLV